MARFKRMALAFAPAFFSFRNMCTISTVAIVMMPSSSCVSGLPSGAGKKKDDENDFFKIFTDKIPVSLKEDFRGLMGDGAGSLKSIFESGVPAQVF